MTIDNRKTGAYIITRTGIEQAREQGRIVFRVHDCYVIRNAPDRDHAAWYRVQVEEVEA